MNKEEQGVFYSLVINCSILQKQMSPLLVDGAKAKQRLGEGRRLPGPRTREESIFKP